MLIGYINNKVTFKKIIKVCFNSYHIKNKLYIYNTIQNKLKSQNRHTITTTTFNNELINNSICVSASVIKYNSDFIINNYYSNTTIKKFPPLEVKTSYHCLATTGARRLQTTNNNGPLSKLYTPNTRLLGSRFLKLNQEERMPLGAVQGGGTRPFTRTLSRGAIVRKKASRESLRWGITGWVGYLHLPLSKTAAHPYNFNSLLTRKFLLTCGRDYSTGIYPNWRITTKIPKRSMILNLLFIKMLICNDWYLLLFYPKLALKLNNANILGMYIAYEFLYFIIAVIAIFGMSVYFLINGSRLAIDYAIWLYRRSPRIILRFLNEETILFFQEIAGLLHWSLSDIYMYIYTYKYDEIIPEEWLPYVGLAGLRRFIKWRRITWKTWRSRAKHRRIARDRIIAKVRRPLKRRARVLYRVLRKACRIAWAVFLKRKDYRVLRRWSIRLFRRWHALWRWFRRNIKRNIYRLQNYIYSYLNYSWNYYFKNYVAIWPFKYDQEINLMLFITWSFVVRLLTYTILICFIIM